MIFFKEEASKFCSEFSRTESILLVAITFTLYGICGICMFSIVVLNY